MTIDEAIEIYELRANTHEREAEYHRPLGYSHEAIANAVEMQAREERQIAKWLKELKEVKAEQTEPQKIGYCNECKWFGDKQVCGRCRSENMYAPKDEPNCSEIPNNCEHITEDGVTCAKYPACDDCLDNPLNKVKGPERLLKGNDEPTISKMEQVDKDINVRSKDEPQTYVINPQEPTNDDKCFACDDFFTCGGQCNKVEDEPQTDCAWR